MNASMLYGFFPPVEIWTSIIAGLAITVFLLLFSHPPLKLPMLFKRYSAAIGSGVMIWILLLWRNGALSINGEIEQWLALSAGGLIFLTAIFCNYYLGMIGAGFRIEMLVNLAETNLEVSLDDWMALYGKGQGMHYFLEDRLKATLIPWRLAVYIDNKIILTHFGQLIGRINYFLAYLFSER